MPKSPQQTGKRLGDIISSVEKGRSSRMLSVSLILTKWHLSGGLAFFDPSL
jgi:hypothetical protein